MSPYFSRRTLLAAAAAILPGAARADDAGLQSLKARIEKGEFRNIHSLQVIQDGTHRLEWYFPGVDERWGQSLGTVPFEAETLHDIRSITKSVTSVLFGIALAEGRPVGLDQPLLDHFPEFPEFRTPEKMRIRLRHVLTMTTGLRWNESLPWTDPNNSEASLEFNQNRLRYILSQPVVAPPGERWSYSAGDAALIAEVVSRATRTPIDDYARTHLFKPLGITRHDWVRDPKDGTPMAGSGLRLRPRDMAKLGGLMLANGRAGGRALLSPDWVAASTKVQTTKGPRPYGYLWWPAVTPGGRSYFRATGNGGQRIMVLPWLRTVAVTTAGMYGDQTASPLVDALAFEAIRLTVGAA